MTYIFTLQTTMFGRKSHGDAKKSAVKILDPKKDTVTRLKHLRIVLETYETHEAKLFFEQYYSYIYYLFHDGFTNVEASLGQRPNKAHREELDFMLFILEKILTLLPEMIHKRWQMHSIGRIMRKLLHTGNSLKLRREGMRLFLLWYEILMENATEECHRMFRSLIPRIGLGNTENSEIDLFTVRTFPNSKVTAPDIAPVLLPQAGDKHPENPSKWMLEAMLHYMVSEVTKIEWNNQELHEYGFNFLFDKFKDFYLPEIFIDFKKTTSIYEPLLDLPEKRFDVADIVAPNVSLCQETVVKWFAIFTSNRSPVPSPSGVLGESSRSFRSPQQSNNATHVDNEPESNEVDIGSLTNRQGDPAGPGGSNASTMSNFSSNAERDSNGSSVCSGGEEHTCKEYEIVQNILYASRENINCIHEVFRQAFLFTFHNGGALRRVIAVYKNWFQDDAQPVFMQEPVPVLSTLSTSARRKSQCDGDIMGLSHSIGMESSRCAVDVRAGLQRVLQVFITNSANVFLLEIVPTGQRRDASAQQRRLEDQIDMCKRVLNIYRYLVMNARLEQATWEQLLVVLLRVTSVVLSMAPPSERDKSLGGRLAEHIFKTLIVTWIKANLNIVVSDKLWEHFLKVLSSLTSWVQLIREWAKTMDMLTRVLARHIYSLDLHDLPLDKLSEQKSKRLRGARTGSLRGRERGQGRGWLKQVSVDNAANVPSSDNSLDAGSSQQILAGPRVMSIRQRSRSGESTPIGLSQNDIQYLNPAVTSVIMSNTVSSLVRSSSDSSIMVPNDKGMSKSATVANCDARLTAELEDNCFNVNPLSREDEGGSIFSFPEGSQFDVDLSAPAPPSTDGANGLPPSAAATVAQMTSGRNGTADGSLTGDRTSMASNNELSLPYLKMSDSNSSAHFDCGSVSDEKSDTEALLRISDSGSFSSNHSSLRRHSKQSAEFRQVLTDHCNGTVASEESECRDESDLVGDITAGDDDVTEEATTGIDVISLGLDEEGVRTDEEEEEIEDAMHSFGDARNGEREICERDSLQIDDGDAIPCQIDDSQISGKISIIAGGTVTGWTPEVAVILWQRMLGSLGNINEIRDPKMHEHVYEYLCDLIDVLVKLRLNLGVTKDNMSTPTPPTYVPPMLFITPWLYEALGLSNDYKFGKLLAYQLLCKVTLRIHDIELPNDHLLRFYMSLHHGLVNSDQDTVNVIVRHCKSRFFALPLPGSTMMILDLIHGANTVLSLPPDVRDSPRAEAMSLLGSLICLPNVFDEVPVLQPNEKELTILKCSDVKDHVVGLLIKFGKREPLGAARCIALSSLGIFLHAELSNGTLHPKVKESVSVLLSALRLNDPAAILVSTHVLELLAEHADILLVKLPDLPIKVIEEIVNVIAFLNEKHLQQKTKTSSQMLVSVVFCLLEWCMKIPLTVLMNNSTSASDMPQKPILHRVFDVLTQVVVGATEPKPSPSTSSQYDTSSAVSSDLSDNESSLPSFSSIVETATQTRSVRTARLAKVVGDSAENAAESAAGGALVKQAARTVLMHLLNYLYHFPLGPGAAQFSSSVHEYCDLYDDVVDDVKLSNTLSACNIQFFVLNNVTLITLIEIPVNSVEDWRGVTAGMTTVNKICRIIIRDPSGKFTWDSASLYGPPNCRSGSYLPEPHSALRIVEENDKIAPETEITTPIIPKDDAHQDSLDMTLQDIERTSPECVLRIGEHLNAPFHVPVTLLPCKTEDEMKTEISLQQNEEFLHIAAHKDDTSVMAAHIEPTESRVDNAMFHLCRLFLDQFGYMAWEKRQRFDLLKKSERLLKDLKHLDSQRCRDTHKIAVIYVADGQEDKTSILSNNSGSPMFEQFVASLGWPVDLETHPGFMGGLQRNQTTGSTAPYYASSTKEVVFHVSTQMPSDTEEDQLKKLRHLGNDEVHIIWSEHSREYRRGIIQTEFADVLIIIYPIHNSALFRIHIICQSQVPHFGPLFDGAIVDFMALPGLVRATAINAGCVIRTVKPFYLPFYEERVRCVENLVQQHKLPTTYETFSSLVFSPALQGELSVAPSSLLNDKIQPLQTSKAAKVNEDNLFSRKLSLVRPKKSSSKSASHLTARASPPRSPNLDVKGKR